MDMFYVVSSIELVHIYIVYNAYSKMYQGCALGKWITEHNIVWVLSRMLKHEVKICQGKIQNVFIVEPWTDVKQTVAHKLQAHF